MITKTVLLLVLSFGLAIVIASYQYYYKAKKRDKLTLFLAFLRFIVVFTIAVLLINPKVKRKTYQVIKPTLSVVYDNSTSIKEINGAEQLKRISQSIASNIEVNEHFDIQSYQFSEGVAILDSIDLLGKKTHLYEVGEYFKSNSGKNKYPLVLITDGNQTDGPAYQNTFQKPTYPIVIGDTTTVVDLSIAAINVNDYVLEGNKFPVELFTNYNGESPVTAVLQIKDQKNKVVYKRKLSYTKEITTQQLEVILPSEKIGLSYYSVELISGFKEKNKKNNTRVFAIEVINQKTKIAIVSSIKHPDVGMLKRAISTNELRQVEVVTPANLKKISAYDLLICYQPNLEFQHLFINPEFQKTNKWMVLGKSTDYTFLNKNNSSYKIEYSSQNEMYLPAHNTGFDIFENDEILFDEFPPLNNKYLTIDTETKDEVLIGSKINSIATGMPLLSFVENSKTRTAYLFGEGIWKWRMANYLKAEEHTKFDLFIDRIIQYLTTERKKQRLKVTHENLFTTATPVIIKAQFYDKTYQLDWNADLEVQISNKKTKENRLVGMTRKGMNYIVSIDDLEPGDYELIVTEKQSNTILKNSFKVIATDLEAYFVSPNSNSLREIAQKTQGQLYMPDQLDLLLASLLTNPEYKPVEKERIITTSIIEWKLLMMLLILFLSLEWFIRKFNGLL